MTHDGHLCAHPLARNIHLRVCVLMHTYSRRCIHAYASPHRQFDRGGTSIAVGLDIPCLLRLYAFESIF